MLLIIYYLWFYFLHYIHILSSPTCIYSSFLVLISPFHLFPSFVHCPTSFHPSQCVVNFISELQEQMCRFQEEINTRIQEKQALKERKAHQEGEPRGHQTKGGPQIGLGCSDLSMSNPDDWTYNGGQTVHVGRFDGWTHHFLFYIFLYPVYTLLIIWKLPHNQTNSLSVNSVLHLLWDVDVSTDRDCFPNTVHTVAIRSQWGCCWRDSFNNVMVKIQKYLRLL